MISLHLKFLTKDGKREYVVLPYGEFVALQKFLEDVEDLLSLREAKQQELSSQLFSLSEIKKHFG